MRRSFGLLALLLAVGCGSEEEKEKIVIGGLISTDGDLAEMGADVLRQVALAIEEINAAGGVLGKPLELKNKNDGYRFIGDEPDFSTMLAAARAHVSEGRQAIINPMSSTFFLTCLEEVTAPAKVVTVSGTSASPALANMDDDGYGFVTYPLDSVPARLLAQRALDAGYQTAAVIYTPDLYGQSVGATFAAEFTAGGGTITFDEPYNPGETNYSAFMNEVLSEQPDAIFLTPYPVDAANIIKAYNAASPVKEPYWYFTDNVYAPAALALLSTTDLNFPHEGATPTIPSSHSDAFEERFFAHYGSYTEFGGWSYDAVYLIALAIEAAGAYDGTKIRDNMLAVSREGTPFGPTQFKEAVAAIKAGEDIDYVGVSGPQDFDDDGNVGAAYNIWRVVNKEVTTLESNQTLH